MNPQSPPPEIQIEPIPFRSGPSSGKPGRSGSLKRIIAGVIGLIFICLIGTAWFVFSAKQVVIGIEPEPDRLSVKGGVFAPLLGDYYLLRPGMYGLEAQKKGYRPLDTKFQVTKEKSQTLSFKLEKLPGEITFTAHRTGQPDLPITGAAVFVDGIEIGKTPIETVPVQAGSRKILVLAEQYQAAEFALNVKGMGQTQAVDVALKPDWADVSIRSVPEGAAVHIDGRRKGKTPVILQLTAGVYDLDLIAEKFKPAKMRLTVVADQAQTLETVHLEPADGILLIQTEPAGATVTVGGQYAGQTPVEIPLMPNREHGIRISKAGYRPETRKIKVAAAEKKTLNVALTPRKGVIHLSVAPSDAVLFIDGKKHGRVPKRLELVAVEHTLEVKKKGHTPYAVKITPRPGFPQQVKVALNPIKPLVKTLPGIIKTAGGYELRLIRPESYVMGSSRREQGRRSNESFRKIVLKRPFYMGTREVTNKEFRAFVSQHDSGEFGTKSLNSNPQPAVRLTWEQAAKYCNRLSKKEGLQPVYAVDGETITAVAPPGTGYRLPTEAEWEYCARFRKKSTLKKYPWGDRFPPENRTVNIADASAKDLLASTLENYEDGYPITAAPGVFSPNGMGLYDVGGNVAEWCHDYYSIYPYSSKKTYTDPVGPKTGKLRVLRGSSWRHAGISALRAAYRDYSKTGRPDLGFRICRYAK